MTRFTGIVILVCSPLALLAQGGDKGLRAQADALFAKGEYAQAFSSYQTLMGNAMEDFDLNFRYGVCALHAGVDKDEVVKYLKRATMGPNPPALAWYYLGKAHHLSYRFKDALTAYERYRGTADRKTLGDHPVDALELQCRNGQNLLSNLKEIDVHNKVEVDGMEFFRFYDLSSIGGKIVVTPEELLSAQDKKSGVRSLIYLPDKGGPIYFASYGKGTETGRDIYRTSLVPSGEFATPVKLAGYINTVQDEDFPFMAPDGKSFYFCSKGHNSMGGYDVFKSSYDKGMDVFGAPVNMDFAVNTPDDDMLYLTDPEGKEACFASGRDSKQGMLHVYRVSTEQAPVNITVLKGTFASAFDANDRKAHIIVQELLTQETVSDVKTDQNGSYVLALPRSGRYRFMVEAGPGGKTHVGMVDIPRNEEPRAYRQELSLVDQGGEKLMIRNYFDEPLEEDLIALALEEIKRRARLDVGTQAPVVEVPEAPPSQDPLTRAGFAGDVTEQAVLEMAATDAKELAERSQEMEDRSKAAYSIAFENAALAENHAMKAEELVAKANASTDEQERNALMTDAARERQAARATAQRAKSAYKAGEELTTERMGANIKSIKATKLNDDLRQLLGGKDDNAKVIRLVELKTRMDEKNAPDGSITAEEKMRRAATDSEREAASLLQRANDARGEENELADRVARKKREENEARGGKKEKLAQERAELEAQLQAMHEENEQAFAKARVAERETATARGKATLAKYLSSDAGDVPVTQLDAEQIARMLDRIEATSSRMGRLALDERFDAAIAEENRAVEQRTFDWGQPLTAGGTDVLASTTPGTMKPDGAVDQPGFTPALQESPNTNDHTTTTGQVTSPVEPAATATDGATTDPSNTGDVAANASTPAGDPRAGNSDAGSPDKAALGSTAPTGTNDGQQPGTTAGGERAATARTDVDVASMRGVPTPENNGTSPDNTSEADGRVVESTPKGVQATPEEIAFVQANQLAELKQERAAEKNRSRRDSLDARIQQLELAMRANADALNTAAADPQDGTRTAGTQAAADGGATIAGITGTDPASTVPPGADEPAVNDPLTADPGASQPAMTFTPAATDEQIIAGIFQDYPSNKARLEAESDANDRASGSHGLELMMVDSIEAEHARQIGYLEAHPDEAPVVLKRIERLRALKEVHIARGDQALAQASQQYATQESRQLEDAAIGRQEPASAEQQFGSELLFAASATPHNDHYVAVNQDPEQVYTSVMDHRATEANEPVQERDRDLALLTGLEEKIDSLEEILESMPRGKSFDRLRESTDRLIDDHIILRTEIGQRMGYISKLEYEAALDSVKILDNATGKLGLAPSEPLMVLAGKLQADAKRDMDLAARTRKLADREEGDILRRDSLLRSAYAQELGALRAMDRVLTVRNYMLAEGFQRGEQLSYEQIEQRLFGPPEPQAVAQRTDAPAPALQAAADPAGTAKPATGTDALAQGRYRNYMSTDTATNAMPAMSTDDAVALQMSAQKATQQARELEDRSIMLADRSNVVQDSAATAKRSERERLELEVARLRHVSDSLHAASLLANARALELERQSAEASEKNLFNERLLKYYYLSDQEQALVMYEEDRSRYFQAKSKAIAQREEAAVASEQSANSKELANVLLKQSADILANKDTAVAPLSREDMAQAARLTDQAVVLTQRADSLRRANERLNMAAAVNEAQAASVLQGLDPERGTEIMALEQRTRRVETVLAQARSRQITSAQPVAGEPIAAARPTAARPDAAPAGGNANAQPTPAEPTGITESGSAAATPTGTTTSSDPRSASDGTPKLLEPLASDEFALSAADAPRAGPIPMDQPMPEGVVFKVQVGAFRHAVPQELFSDMAPVVGESVGNGLTRYTAGMFTSAEGAARATEQVRKLGYRDAFVVAYQNGQRVPLGVAMRAIRPVAIATAALPAGRPVEIRVPANAFALTPLPLPVADASDAEVLAKYPESAEAVLAQFAPPADAAAYYNDPKAAPARQVETVKGLFFTVQVGVYSKPTALDKLFNVTPLNSERTENAKIRYTTGVFTDMDKARVRKDETVSLGVKDAFITAYLNGKRIPMRDARALIAKFGPQVFADPSIITK